MPRRQQLADPVAHVDLRREYALLLEAYAALVESIGLCCLPLSANIQASGMLERGRAVLAASERLGS